MVVVHSENGKHRPSYLPTFFTCYTWI